MFRADSYWLMFRFDLSAIFVVGFPVYPFLRVAVLAFLADSAVDTKCRLTIEMKTIFSTDI